MATAPRPRVACPHEGCTKSYINKCDLDDHISSQHGGGPLHRCDCGVQFPSASNLRRHQVSAHQQVSVKCRRCGDSAPGSRTDNYGRKHKPICANPPTDGNWNRAFEVVKGGPALQQSETRRESHSDESQSGPETPMLATPTLAMPTPVQDPEMTADDKWKRLQSICGLAGFIGQLDQMIEDDDLVFAVGALGTRVDIPDMALWTYRDLDTFVARLSPN